MQRRYQSLQLHDAISRREDYAEACRELRCILRGAYVYAPKPFQAQLHEDVRLAFRTSPKMENSRQLDAARALLQTVEAIFANKHQELAPAAHEFETAATARQRQQEYAETPPDSLNLSRDILLHVFRSLDARSLATVSAVCREWNVAATEDSLWHTQFLYLFGSLSLSANVAGREKVICELDWKEHLLQKPQDNSVGAWRKAFSFAAKGSPSHLLTSNRACCSVCNAVIWLPEPRWRAVMEKCKQSLQHHSPKPMSVSQVVRYVVCGDFGTSTTDSKEQ